eukprot:evm.model.NODE_39505_length_72863_cov_22.203917.16
MASNILNLLRSAELVRVGGDAHSSSPVLGFDVIKGKVLLLYFSARWCPPCRSFTPKLKTFYEKVANESPVEVVWVSSDDSQTEWNEYGSQMAPYLAVPYANDALRTRLKQELGVCAGKEQGTVGVKERKRGIPTLAVIKPDGTLVTLEGDEELEKTGLGVMKEWGP